MDSEGKREGGAREKEFDLHDMIFPPLSELSVKFACKNFVAV